MISFFSQQLLSPNIAKVKFTNKVKIRPQDISMEYLLSREIGNDYKVEFLLQLNPAQSIQDPSKILSNSDIDMISLRNSIISKLVPLDKKYMLLKSFSSIKSEFHFDSALWLKDTLSNVEPKTSITSFSRTFKFKVPLPPMILRDAIRNGFPKFLIKKFKNYLNSQPKVHAWFKHLFPDGIKSISVKLPERFEYSYDYQTNAITLKLKTFWIMALIYAIGEFTKINKDRNVQKKLQNPGSFFNIKVKQQIPNFNNIELRQFLGKKFL